VPYRSPLFRIVFALIVGWALLGLTSLTACGRSDLDDYLLPDAGDGGPDARDSGADVVDGEGGPDVLACNQTTCPTGCCTTGGQCATGASLTACGTLGETCQDCKSEGFQLCDPTRRACGNPVATCDPATCSGCCEGNECFAGSDPNECGKGGETCLHCESNNLACVGNACVTPACGPGSCSGCCFGEQCVSGTDQSACGDDGQVCGNCLATGGTCAPQSGGGGVCQGQTACNPGNCQGCCQGTSCLTGNDPQACGIGGTVCTNCAQTGGQCIPEGPTGGFCSNPQSCDATNCTGCCEQTPQGGSCVPGTDPTACGAGGNTCEDCTAFNGTCGGGQCIGPPPPVCDPSTCPTGCCDGTNCLPGNLDTFCGTGGVACVDCETSKKTCSTGQTCAGAPPTCDATNCQGCCDQSNTCQAGFIDTQCGQAGASCEDCTQIVPASTCDVDVSPRTCQSQQVQCPAPYPSCPGSLETPSPTQQNVCSASDLQNAAAACEGGAHSDACNSFFSFEKTSNPSCAACLTPFDYDFSELTGLTTCAAPFVDASCNHTTACLVDCTDKSCAQCVDSGALQDCQAAVPNSVCAVYYAGAQCIENAFVGPGSFCDPNQGSGLFGDWLQQVGQNYCEQ